MFDFATCRYSYVALTWNLQMFDIAICRYSYATSCLRVKTILCPIESVDSSVPVCLKILKNSRWFRSRRAVGFDRASGAIESNCPSGSKSSWIFQNFHADRDGTVHTLDGTVYIALQSSLSDTGPVLVVENIHGSSSSSLTLPPTSPYSSGARGSTASSKSNAARDSKHQRVRLSTLIRCGGPCMLDRIQVGVHRRGVHCGPHACGPVPPASRAEGARGPGARVHERGAHSGPLSYGPPPESYQAYMDPVDTVVTSIMKMLKLIRDDFSATSMGVWLDSIALPARLNPTARRRRNHVEFAKLFTAAWRISFTFDRLKYAYVTSTTLIACQFSVESAQKSPPQSALRSADRKVFPLQFSGFSAQFFNFHFVLGLNETTVRGLFGVVVFDFVARQWHQLQSGRPTVAEDLHWRPSRWYVFQNHSAMISDRPDGWLDSLASSMSVERGMLAATISPEVQKIMRNVGKFLWFCRPRLPNRVAC